MLRSIGQELSSAELRTKVREIDADGSGTLDFEVLSCTLIFHCFSNEQGRFSDENHAGCVKEFVDMMNKWQDRELNDMFDYFNVDGDETIGIDELKTAIDQLVMHEQSRAPAT